MLLVPGGFHLAQSHRYFSECLDKDGRGVEADQVALSLLDEALPVLRSADHLLSRHGKGLQYDVSRSDCHWLFLVLGDLDALDEHVLVNALLDVLVDGFLH